MKPLKLRYSPDPFLLKPSQKIQKIRPSHIRTSFQMAVMMNSMKALGLSAPQVGVPFAIIVMNTSGYPHGKIRTMFNPEIVESSEELFTWNEGCLSFPDKFIETNRPNKVKVKYLNFQGHEMIEEFEGVSSICVQHEIDHINGVLFVDKFEKK